MAEYLPCAAGEDAFVRKPLILGFLLAALAGGGVVGCSGDDSDPTSRALSMRHEEGGDRSSSAQRDDAAFSIDGVRWDDDDEALTIRGEGDPGDEVTVADADTGARLGTFEVREDDGAWRVKVEDLETPPCRVAVTGDNGRAEADVGDAPDDCGIQGGDGGPGPVMGGNIQVFAINDLGMHCMDEDSSVFEVLPPFNTVHAQVIRKGGEPEILAQSQAAVRYQATADPSGSINSTSIGKTDFWQYVEPLFGLNPPPDVGLTGSEMPSEQFGPQLFEHYDTAKQWFTAEGIPITPIDDAGNYNPYPLFRIQSLQPGSTEVTSELDVVVPVSTEMNCSECHNNGGVAANDATAAKYNVSAWTSTADPVVQYKENILILHDAINGTQLLDNQPVLCADCHYSPALDLAGNGPPNNLPFMSRAVHGRHGLAIDGTAPTAGNPPIINDEGKEACYNCHPGKVTQCFRGAMFAAGLACQNCHGGLLQVAGANDWSDGEPRMPWVDMPKCQSCHTGDALNHLGGEIILTTAFENADTAEPRAAPGSRFAENAGTLYRNSTGHGGVACAMCHGSPHAIWPVADPGANDNITAEQLQGHAGFIIECAACHQDQLPLTMEGPHRMHNVGDPRWNENHEDFYEQNPAACQACHGTDLQGTVLSLTTTERTLQTDGDGAITLAEDTPVACNLCHEMPD